MCVSLTLTLKKGNDDENYFQIDPSRLEQVYVTLAEERHAAGKQAGARTSARERLKEKFHKSNRPARASKDGLGRRLQIHEESRRRRSVVSLSSSPSVDCHARLQW